MKVLTLFILVLINSKAFAFGGDLHIKLTIEALEPYGFSPEVAKQIGIANDHVDKVEMLNNAAHADSESFEAASALMRQRLRKAAEYLLLEDLKNARDTFGYITHTVQDFFSHSNYVEFMAGEPIDLLNLKNPSPDIKCAKDDRRNGLTSGYFPNENTPPGKCSHEDLNKDGGAIYIPHYRAANFARKKTSEMYERFEQEVQNLTGNSERTKMLLHKFKDGDHAADSYNSFKNETARAMVKVYPSPQKQGKEINVVFTSEQFCEEFQVDIIDLQGRNIGDGQGAPYIFKSPMEKNESKVFQVQTYNLAPALYLMRAVYEKCEGNGRGNQVFKFIIIN